MERGGVPHPLIVRLDNVTKQTGYVKHKTFKRRSEASDSDGLIPLQSRNIAEKRKPCRHSHPGIRGPAFPRRLEEIHEGPA